MAEKAYQRMKVVVKGEGEDRPVMKVSLRQTSYGVEIEGEDAHGTKWTIARLDGDGMILINGINTTKTGWPITTVAGETGYLRTYPELS